MKRLSPHLLAAAGIVVGGLVAAVVLQDHFVADFTARVNVVPRSYRLWRDPVAVLCAFGSVAFAARIAVGRGQRLQLAVGLLGCAFAAAIYSHQENFRFACPPGDHCEPITLRPDLWHDSRAQLILAVGVAAAAVLAIPWRSIVPPLMHPRRG